MNPELRRNFWLEITLHRLLAMPAVMILILIAIAAIDKDNAVERINWFALAAMGVSMVLWGTRLAANSIFDELADKTWDWQRLSTLRPWTMTWGKLFGSTLFAWYTGIWCLGVFLATAHASPLASPLKTAGILLLLAIAMHAISIASALQVSRKTGGGTPNRRSLGLLLLLVTFYIVSFSIQRGVSNRTGTLQWYYHHFDFHDFALLSVSVFALWAVLGAYRTMCQSLAVRTTPWAALAFILFLTFYFSGFAQWMHSGVPPQLVLLSGLFWSAMFTYAMLFSEPTGPIVIRRLIRKMQTRQWRRALEETPLWPLTWIYAAACAVGLAAMGAGQRYDMVENWSMAPLPFVLLVARDAAILVFFSAASNPKRAVGATLVYLLLLDAILPTLLNAVGLASLADVLLPLGSGNIATQLASAAAQAAVAIVLAYKRLTHS